MIFAHGSGSSRLSPRNIQVAAALTAAGLGTLLFDLLDRARSRPTETTCSTFALLAGRLVAATRWAHGETELDTLPVGYFGSSTGAAAALCAAADLGDGIRAVVSRGGRADLAGPRLGELTAPTLLIVGGADHVVLELNKQALADLRCPKELMVVPGATHLFEEPGALEQVAAHAARWFSQHLPQAEHRDNPRHKEAQWFAYLSATPSPTTTGGGRNTTPSATNAARWASEAKPCSSPSTIRKT